MDTEFPNSSGRVEERLDAKEDLFVLDVREPHEYQICNIGGYLIPLSDLPKRVNELDSTARSSCTARWADAAPRRWPSCDRQDSTRCITWRAGSGVGGSCGSEGAEVLTNCHQV